ncbi:MAG: ubiquinone/menaquinone biosynthesis methyltransferase [Anaerolineaceae bacterium]|nr:MAG: ubiquinone/menaquinone biosynthesis methyltransferase [Anaerolineaceae bacterium]
MILWIAIIVVILIAAGFLLEREIYFYEGVHLGPRVQGWLYDRWAKKYDADKQASQARDAEVIVRPLLDALTGIPAPLVLDVATGTGRFPSALLGEAGFGGHVIALDISRGMLELAAQKLASRRAAVTLMHTASMPLPFPDATFDAVSCFEALEVMPAMEAPLAELYRLLRPGGILVTSRGTEESGRKAKVKSAEQFTALLQKTGFENVEIQKWWKLFDFVRARKPGRLVPAGKRALADALKCPRCGKVEWAGQADGPLRCGACGSEVPVSAEKIVLYPS